MKRRLTEKREAVEDCAISVTGEEDTGCPVE